MKPSIGRSKVLLGGLYASRTDAEDRVGCSGIVIYGGVIPLMMFFSKEPAVPMIMSIYVTLGIFLLLAVRDPAANRSLIAFGGWANLAHAGVMAAQEYRNVIERRELAGVIVFAIVGVVLVALAPRSNQLRGHRLRLVG